MCIYMYAVYIYIYIPFYTFTAHNTNKRILHYFTSYIKHMTPGCPVAWRFPLPRKQDSESMIKWTVHFDDQIQIYSIYIYVLYMCKELQYIQYIHVYTQMKPAQAKPQSVVDINFQPTSLNMPRHEQEPLFNKENRSRSRSKHWSFSAKCCGFAAGVVPGSSSMTNLVVFGIGGWVKTYKMSSL